MVQSSKYLPDTAQSYGNEAEVGDALKDSGLARDDIYITTKYSGTNGLKIEESIRNSVKNVSFCVPKLSHHLLIRSQLGVKSVDLYLVHSPRLAVPDIPTVWAQMEKAKSDGLTKSVKTIVYFHADSHVLFTGVLVSAISRLRILKFCWTLRRSNQW